MKFFELSPWIYYEKSFQNTLMVEVESNSIKAITDAISKHINKFN